MNDNQILQILKSTRTIATVGLSTNPTKDSHSIAAYLQSQGYRVIPVNPTAEEILGEKSYPDLLAIPVKVDVVQVFRPPQDVPQIVEQAIQIGAKVVWMQLDTGNPQAAQMAQAAGLQVVMERCMRIEHQRLLG